MKALFRTHRSQSFAPSSDPPDSSRSDEPPRVAPAAPIAIARSTPIARPPPSYIASSPIPSYDVATSPLSRSVALSSIAESSSGIRDYFQPREGTREGEEDDDDPLIPRPSAQLPAPTRRNTLASLPLPRLSPTLESESSIGTSYNPAIPLELGPSPVPATLPAYSANLARDELRLISTVHLADSHPASGFFNASTPSVPRVSEECCITTGGKRLKLTLTRGACRVNANGTGPIFIKLGRGDRVEGIVEVGKGEGGIGLDVVIVGMVNTSYYVRGQYNLLDSVPLVQHKLVLFPPSADASTAPTAPSLLTPGESFTFSVVMPETHWRDTDVDLPPSAMILQVGMQIGIEYMLDIKLIRKGWRLNETLSLPLFYEPRGYVNPERLRRLTTTDALNPGWRTIKLHGGNPIVKGNKTAISGPGVDATILLPSPPIVFIAHGAKPPPIPFHLHFHSTLPLPLQTFSDPHQCTFVVRLMRCASMKVGLDREVRRIEIPSKVEVWQDGAERIALGNTYLTRTQLVHRTSDTRGFGIGRRRLSEVVETTTPVEPSRHALSDTDVHLHGLMTIDLPTNGPETLKRLIQSFQTPEITITYVIEVGIAPRSGAVKEAFAHMWGGGIVEVVLGARR
ncbi:hypothetical protein P7C73_g334, partial [Tremellales sp. Uapishka_1]